MSEHKSNEEIQSLKDDIKNKQTKLREEAKNTGNIVPPRTQAVNAKYPAKTVEEDKKFKGEILASQISSWREILPAILKGFSKIPDSRRLKSVNLNLSDIT